MTLIYRGQKYVQNKEATKKQHNQLTYRGKAYTSQFIYPINKKATLSGFFYASNSQNACSKNFKMLIKFTSLIPWNYQLVFDNKNLTFLKYYSSNFLELIMFFKSLKDIL